jgi:hypothetical protein
MDTNIPEPDPEFDIDEQYSDSKELLKVMAWADAFSRLELRLKDLSDLDSEIHTEEILRRRYKKHSENPYAQKYAKLKTIKTEQRQLEHDMQELRPKVWGTTELTLLSDHERMSQMNDRRKELDIELDNYLAEFFPKMKRIIPGVYEKIINGIDEEDLNIAFKMMRRVINGQINEKQAVNTMMDQSEKKYGLPKGFYKNMRM